MMRLSYRGRYAIYSRSVIGCLHWNRYALKVNVKQAKKYTGGWMIDVDRSSIFVGRFDGTLDENLAEDGRLLGRHHRRINIRRDCMDPNQIDPG